MDAALKMKCPRCGSFCYYTRLRDGSHVCRRCAYVWRGDKVKQAGEVVTTSENL